MFFHDVFDLWAACLPRHLFGQAVLGRPGCSLLHVVRSLAVHWKSDCGGDRSPLSVHPPCACDRQAGNREKLMCALCFYGMFLRKEQRSVQLFQAYRTWFLVVLWWWFLLSFCVKLTTVHVHFPWFLDFPMSASRWCCWCSDWQQIRGALDARFEGMKCWTASCSWQVVQKGDASCTRHTPPFANHSKEWRESPRLRRFAALFNLSFWWLCAMIWWFCWHRYKSSIWRPRKIIAVKNSWPKAGTNPKKLPNLAPTRSCFTRLRLKWIEAMKEKGSKNIPEWMSFLSWPRRSWNEKNIGFAASTISFVQVEALSKMI